MNMTVDFHTDGADQADSRGGGGNTGSGQGGGAGSPTRSRILQIALTLMAQRGVDGTSMRDLASAAGLNVASLYHYFPSKRELLEAVLLDHGFLPVHAPRPEPLEYTEEINSPLAQLLAEILLSMFEVEDFVRLMVGEAIRGESTARAVGLDLFTTFEASIADWITKHRPDLCESSGAGNVARLLSAMIVGTFVQHAAGALPEDSTDLVALSMRRARETADILRPPE